MSKDSRVVKFKRRRTINIGIIIFLILFIYIAINVYVFLTKDHISIYEVQEGFNTTDNRITGFILREEKVITSSKAGYIFYFQKEGARVSKAASIFSVDDSTQIMDIITSDDEAISLSNDNSKQFHYNIKKFHNLYSDNNFSYVYDFKYDLENTMLDLINQTIIDKGLQIQEDTGFAFNYEVFKSEASGIVTYYMDNYETVTRDTITNDIFNTDNYKKTQLRTSDIVSINTPVYKLVSSEDWSIILPLTNEQYESLLGKERVEFTILNDDFTTSAPLDIFHNPTTGSFYAELFMDKHLSNYLEDRYLDIELHLETTNGLKVPLSAVTTKDFYLVPLSYFTTGGNSDEEGLIREEYDKDTGEVKLIFVAADIYYQDEVYGYVDTNQFPPYTWVRSTEGNRYQLSITNKLTGVYNVNMGYAVFKRIEIIYQNKEYCIIDRNTSYGLSLYDHIALDANTVIEQKIIY